MILPRMNLIYDITFYRREYRHTQITDIQKEYINFENEKLRFPMKLHDYFIKFLFNAKNKNMYNDHSNIHQKYNRHIIGSIGIFNFIDCINNNELYI